MREKLKIQERRGDNCWNEVLRKREGLMSQHKRGFGLCEEQGPGTHE